ncbi:uncharacterized protein LOC131876635 [Cryptomeria japonica]|uniref:uncharacterized protein LOC131876635 n=1 Tax=Cryptomeria japonica TaxID=3369 RepID=UPI0027DA5B28|nr:uncharacterized protein LOC131876635 [Cryptomeria japonica]
MTLPPEVRELLTLDQFLGQKNSRIGSAGRAEYRTNQGHRDFQHMVGKLTLPYFDGSGTCSARAWVQKLDNYISLRPMPEEEAIKFATLHLDGIAHEWWYHGPITLGHRYITSYDELTNRLIKHFDHKDPEMFFRELAQLKQYGSLEAYISEFQRLSVMVPDITKRRLIVLFIEGLADPLRSWVRAFDSPSLQHDMKKARSMEHADLKHKSSSKPFQSNNDKKPFHKNSDQQKKPFQKHNEESLNDLRRRNLCFKCNEPWDPKHKCASKGKANQLEYFSGDDASSENSDQHTENEDSGGENASEGSDKGLEEDKPMARLSSIQREASFRMRGVLAGQRVVTLLDTGATHNFINEGLIAKRGIQTKEFEGFRVRVADGFILTCSRRVLNLPLRLNDYEFKADYYVVGLKEMEVILGMKWLHQIEEFYLNVRTMEMRFEIDGRKHVLRGMTGGSVRIVSLRMERLICHEQVEWAAECVLMPTTVEQQKREYPPQIQQMLTKHSKVFSDIPPGRPPDRGIEHIIELEGSKPIIITPYRHHKRLKDEIEKTIKELLDMGHIRPSKSPFASAVVLVKNVVV